jgi:alpha-mannosidase
VNKLNFFQPYGVEYYQGLKQAHNCLQQAFYQNVGDKKTPQAFVVGHTHIDLAWLWTVMQAVEKGERSFSTVLNLMNEYDELTFIQSQPQMYQLIKDTYPELYEKIKEKVITGKWIPEGAMWVEADCNLTSGESLVRQFLYGKRFIKREFGVESKILWLPDVFGYSAALPQILKKTNTPYFMTTKLSWNQFNQIPYDSFYWQGIDGSRTLTHLITTISEGYSPTPHYTTYNGILDPYTVKKSWERYLDKDVHTHILLAYGYGDGGGGPTREMLEILKRMKNGLPSMPKVVESNAVDFFQDLSEVMKTHQEKEWLGEMYFEYHRGTYTSIGKNKRNNRLGENLVQTVEKLYSVLDRMNYPDQVLEKTWKKLLLNQFHDILPGSSIKEVYDQTDSDYKEMFHEMQKLITNLFPEKAKDKYLYLFNPSDIDNANIVSLPLRQGESLKSYQQELVMQRTYDGQTLGRFDQLPILGGIYYEIEEKETDKTFDPIALTKQYETQEFIISFDESYRMIRVFDKKNQRELATKKAVNELLVYEDLPLNFDAWDIDYYYKNKPTVVTNIVEAWIMDQGPIRDTLKIVRKFYDSTITQYIHLIHDKTRIDFETIVDWHQVHSLLRVEFPVPVNVYQATYDIQFGNLQRPVHKNTSWDKAKFEVCAYKWVDLSDDGYEVSLLTDSKYGFDAQYQHLGISLIKSATDPYEKADQGRHQFIYSLYCHDQTWKQGKTHQEARQLNIPCLSLRQEDKRFPEGSWVTGQSRNICLETLKKAEENHALIFRAYEFENKQTQMVLKFSQPIKNVQICDLLENPHQELPIENGNEVTVIFSPYEIHTLKIQLKDEQDG